jgi:phenylacetate-CoA ligase
LTTVAIEDLLHPFVGRYLRAPRWVKASAGAAYACLPQRMRLGPEYGRFLDEIGIAEGREATARLAREKLGRTLRWALETVPAYHAHRGLLRANRDPLEILARLPVVDKLEIKRNTERFVSRGLPDSARLEMFTGGSTPNPMRFYLHKHVSRPKEYAFIHRFRQRVGARPGDLMLALRGRTVPSAGRRGGRLWTIEPIKRQLILSSDHLERRFMPAYAEALTRHRPAYIEAFPSALYPLARWLAANPLPEFTDHVKGVMLYSENVYGFQLAKLREVFRCPIVMHYGHSERVLMAASMPDDDRYFFWPQYGHFELVDSNDMPVRRPGVPGFVVGTSFDNHVMPFVRYRTGDLAMLSDRPHPDLPGYLACERIMGRLQEFIVCRDRRLVSITALGVAHFPELSMVEAIQYEQDRPGMLVLKVVAETRLDARQLERMAAAVARKTQGGCHVKAVQVDAIPRTPRGKARMMIQHLDIRSYFGAPVEVA